MVLIIVCLCVCVLVEVARRVSREASFVPMSSALIGECFNVGQVTRLAEV